MSENLKKFLEAVSKNDELCEKVGKAGMDELIAMAKDMGIAITEADFKKPNELDDDELDAVSAGIDVSCACAMGGGGTKDDNDKTCACVIAGGGYSRNGRERCVCGIAGCGYDT